MFGQIYFTSSDVLATLPNSAGAKYTFTSGDKGVHTYSGFILRTVGTQTITVTDGAKSTTSNSITVNSGDSSEFSYITWISPTSASAGASTLYTYTLLRNLSYVDLGWAAIKVPASFTGVSVVSVVDSSPPGGTWDYSVVGNIIIIHAHSSSSELQLHDQYIRVVFSATASYTLGKSAQFTSITFENYDGTGYVGLLVNSNPTGDPTVTVTPGALDHFTLTGAPASTTAGSSFGSITVKAYDACGNLKTDYTGSAYFSSTDNQASLPYTSLSKYTFAAGDLGSKTFSSFTLKTAGSQTITVTDSVISATSGSITVNPATASVQLFLVFRVL